MQELALWCPLCHRAPACPPSPQVGADWQAVSCAPLRVLCRYHRIEVLGALGSVLTVWLVTGVLLFEAVNRLITPEPVNGKSECAALLGSWLGRQGWAVEAGAGLGVARGARVQGPHRLLQFATCPPARLPARECHCPTLDLTLSGFPHAFPLQSCLFWR